MRDGERRIPFGTLLDYALPLLILVTVGWLLLVAERTGGDAMAACGILVFSATTYLIASAVARRHGWIIPILLLVGLAGFALIRLDVLLNRPLNAPLGYSNAAGALFMLAAAAALLLSARVPRRSLAAVALLVAIPFAAVPWLNATLSAAVLVTIIPLALLARNGRWVRFAVLGGAAAYLASFAAVGILGFTYNREQVPAWIGSTLTERRLMLWRDAFDLIAAHPGTGVGPSLFPAHSPTAMRNRDTIWPHNELLHFGAETGVLGLVLLLALFAWAFLRLWYADGDTGTAVAALALAATGIQANVDYILHYPAVPIVLAALVAAGAHPPRSARRSHPKSTAPSELLFERFASRGRLYRSG